METVGQSSLYTFRDGSEEAHVVRSHSAIRSGKGHLVTSYMDLAKKIAELQFRNSEHVLLFRGQSSDHRNQKGNSTLKPTILRGTDAGNPIPGELEHRFGKLGRAEQALVEEYNLERFLGRDRLSRQRIVRWSVLQHYEICPTPLLDVTHSLRVAASFATGDLDREAYIYALAVPHLSGALTASADAGLQIARLASMCPPIAVRPHVQEGYLIGEYPELGEYRQKSLYQHHEVDLGRRLVAKFRFVPRDFWARSKGFPPFKPKTLAPATHTDPFAVVAKRIKNRLNTE